MKRAGWSSILVAILVLFFGVAAEAQQQAKAARVGFLMASSPGADARVEAFRQGLRDLGYIEGKNIAIEWRYAQGKEDRVPKLAAELVQLNVEIIVEPM